MSYLAAGAPVRPRMAGEGLGDRALLSYDLPGC